MPVSRLEPSPPAVVLPREHTRFPAAFRQKGPALDVVFPPQKIPKSHPHNDLRRSSPTGRKLLPLPSSSSVHPFTRCSPLPTPPLPHFPILLFLSLLLPSLARSAPFGPS